MRRLLWFTPLVALVIAVTLLAVTFARRTEGQAGSDSADAASASQLAARSAIPVSADGQWPQFRGPTEQGVALSSGVPLTWSETEHVAWKTEIPGQGWSSPVVWGKQAWMTTALEDGGSLRAICVDVDSGAILHNIEVFRPAQALKVNPKNSHASPTPVIEEGRVYVHFGTYGTACLDTASGSILWANHDLQIDHKEGPGSSPILYKNLVITNCDGMDAQYIAALDKQTGRLAWKTDRTGPPHPDTDQRKAYSTPLLINFEGRDQLISTCAGRVISYDPNDGQELWKVYYVGYSNVPRPVFGAGMVFLSTGYNVPQLWAIRPDGEGDVTSTHVAWKFTKQVPANPSPLILGAEVYFISDNGVVTCLDAATGREIWKKRVGGNHSASPVYVENPATGEGRIYFFSEDGQIPVIAPGRQFKELAQNRIEGRLFATPAILPNAMLLRSDTHLYRIQEP